MTMVIYIVDTERSVDVSRDLCQIHTAACILAIIGIIYWVKTETPMERVIYLLIESNTNLLFIIINLHGMLLKPETITRSMTKRCYSRHWKRCLICFLLGLHVIAIN
jgi:hypothetical protein